MNAKKKKHFFLGQTPMKIWFRCAAEVFFSGNDIFSFQDPATPRRSFWAPNNSGITKAQNETTANVRFPSTFYTAIDINWLVLSSYTLGLFNSKIKKKNLWNFWFGQFVWNFLAKEWTFFISKKSWFIKTELFLNQRAHCATLNDGYIIYFF